MSTLPFTLPAFTSIRFIMNGFLITTASAFGIPRIYKIRNEGMIECYNFGGAIYKWFRKSTILNSTSVLCQGWEYMDFLKSKFKKESVYYPNYIMDDFMSPNDTERRRDPVLHLVYFGRVVKDKNIDFIIETYSQLTRLNVDYDLSIIDGYEESYYQQLTHQIKQYNLDQKKDKILWSDEV